MSTLVNAAEILYEGFLNLVQSAAWVNVSIPKEMLRLRLENSHVVMLAQLAQIPV
jgi:hypothetical protein